MSEPGAPTLAVIGAGIAGLAAAHRARELWPELNVRVFEAGPRPGGVLRSEHSGGYLLEHSADSFITDVPWALDLCRRLGIDDQLISTNPKYRRALVVRDGRLYPVPEGFMLMAPGRWASIIASPLLSWRGKLRLAGERFAQPRTASEDESIASFARRRLGSETFERLVQPLVGGIYTGDAEKLSLAATLPRFRDMEREHGSLTKAMLARRRQAAGSDSASGARYGLFTAPAGGMQVLTDSLAARIGRDAVSCDSPIESVRPLAAGRWELTQRGGALWKVDGVVLATSAPVSASIVQNAATGLAAELAGIEYADSIVALIGYRRDDVKHPLDAFGVVVPKIENRRILAVSFSSQKFADRAPPGEVLLRVFLGGATQPEWIRESDEALRDIVTGELEQLLGAAGDPTLFRLVRWPGAMPQYHLGHLERISRIEQHVALLEGLEIAGSAYGGVGVPHCIASGEAAADRAIQTLRSRS